jgi:hypothetical protein
MSSFAPYLIAMAAGFPSAFFGYLRYRAYVGLGKKLVEKEGSKGLRALEHVAHPWRPVAVQLGRKRAGDEPAPMQLRGVA